MTVVRSPQDLDALPRNRDVNGLLSRSRIAFEMPNVPMRDQIRWAGILNGYQSRCGCVAGAVCTLTTLIGGVLWLAATGGSVVTIQFLGRALLVLLASVVVGLIGKLVSLQITRAQFAEACRRLLREISSAPPNSKPTRMALER